MTITPAEAQIVLIALDVADAMGWDGSPSNILLESAKSKLEELAGGPTPPTLEVLTLHIDGCTLPGGHVGPCD